MDTNKIETMIAEDFLQEHLEISHFYSDAYEEMCCLSSDLQKAMKEYAKLKCQELLLVVAEKAEISYNKFGEEYVDKDSILNAVDLEKFCS